MISDTMDTILNNELKALMSRGKKVSKVIKIENKKHKKFPAESSYKTARNRSGLSKPIRFLLESKAIKGKVLDYGCGFGQDAKALDFDMYDPHFYPDGLDNRKKYDTIVCNYVLNVVDPIVECKIIADISKRLKKGGRAYFTVRRDRFKEGTNSRGTYQRTSTPLLESYAKFTGRFEVYVLRANEF